MAIKLRVQTDEARLNVREPEAVRFEAEQGIPIYPNAYQGEYTVTPSRNTQTLATSGLMMNRNITVNPIPSNYGLITWNGSTLTVS